MERKPKHYPSNLYRPRERIEIILKCLCSSKSGATHSTSLLSRTNAPQKVDTLSKHIISHHTYMKKFNRKYRAIIPILALGVLGASGVSAHSWFMHASPDEIAAQHQTMFQKQADLLGVSVDEVKTAWADGKTIAELAAEKGISETELRTRMQNAKKEEFKKHLTTLVEKGIITQAQADKRLSVMTQRIDSNTGKRIGGRMHHGFGF